MTNQSHPPTSIIKPLPPEVLSSVDKGTKPFRTFITKFNNDWSMSFAGLLAYNLLMAMLPIAIAIISLLGFILAGNLSLRDSMINQIAQIFPGATSQQNAIDLAFRQLQNSAGLIGLIAIALAIFGGSRLFIAVEGCLDIIYRVRPRKLLRQNIMAIGMLLLFIVLIPIMIFASAIPSILVALLQSTPLMQSTPLSALLHNAAVISLAAILGGLIAAFILFEVTYFVVPNQRISWRNSWCGAVVAAIALEFFLILFPFYTARFMGGYVGQVGFAVILLLFFYYFAVILLLGAEVNAFFFEGIRPIPNDLATFVSTMAGLLNQDIPEIESKYHQEAKATHDADRAHIAAERDKEEQIQQINQEKQRQIASQTLHKSAKQDTQQKGSKLTTTLGVVAGTLLAAVIEWFRLHRWEK